MTIFGPNSFIFGVALSAFLITGAAQAQEEDFEQAGRDDYAENCLVCHGPEGKGNGSWADYMSIPPPDLTTLAQRNGDRYPYYRVYRIIEKGRHAPEHAFSSMPAWGKIFAEQQSAFFTDTAIESRLLDLVEYIESIQVRGEGDRPDLSVKPEQPGNAAENPASAETPQD